MSSSTRIVESRNKGFVLDLKLLFTIVDCFSGRFPPQFFTVKLVGFIGFLEPSYLVLFIFPLHDFDMILMFHLFVCLFVSLMQVINEASFFNVGINYLDLHTSYQ